MGDPELKKKRGGVGEKRTVKNPGLEKSGRGSKNWGQKGNFS